MHIAALALAIILLLSGVAVNSAKTKLKITNNSEVLSEQTAQPSPTNSATPSPTPTSTVTTTPTASSTAAPTSTSQPVSNNSYIYPNSKIVSQPGSETVLESSDNPDTITTWYQDKIKSDGFNIKNFVKTKVNGKVENKLAGADGDREINIEITKEVNSQIVVIKIN